MQPVLTIDLDAVAANYTLLRATAKGAICASVVKANGYGLGAEAVAKRLHLEGCRTFFTANFDEALELRPHLPDAVLYVLSGLCGAKPQDYTSNGIRPVLNEVGEIAAWAKNDAGNCILHVDTGMNRLGLPMDQLAAADQLKPDYIMSHLACSETPNHPMNEQQLVAFNALSQKFPGIAATLAATAGILLGPDYACDLVRPGIGLYGGNPFVDRPNPMQDVIRIDAPILQIRTLKKGETVGYSGDYLARGGERIATLGIGYADGYGRAFDRNGIGELDGNSVRLVGRVSMDYVTFDVTDCPETTLAIGKFITLAGGPIPVDEALKVANIGPYEFFTGLGQRFQRNILP